MNLAMNRDGLDVVGAMPGQPPLAVVERARSGVRTLARVPWNFPSSQHAVVRASIGKEMEATALDNPFAPL